jgi:hypothetical protein
MFRLSMSHLQASFVRVTNYMLKLLGKILLISKTFAYKQYFYSLNTTKLSTFFYCNLITFHVVWPGRDADPSPTSSAEV